MEASSFDEVAFFDAIERSGARALLIGRRALVLLGAPVLTGDYDFWLHPDDIERFNQALEPFGLFANHPPEAARRRGRYVLENDERVDVLVSLVHSTVTGPGPVSFVEVWQRCRRHPLAHGVSVAVPRIEDLMATKRFAARPKDAEDLRWLERLLAARKAAAPGADDDGRDT